MDLFRSAREALFLRRPSAAALEGGGDGVDADVERQARRPPEMQESSAPPPPPPLTATSSTRSSPVSFVLRRFADLPRPSLGGGGGGGGGGGPPRPSSSHYSASSSTHHGRDFHGHDNAGLLRSPKTPPFALDLPPMPSTRLHLPTLQRTWTHGSNGPPSPAAAGVAVPVPAVPAQHLRHGRTTSSGSSSSSSSSSSSRGGGGGRAGGGEPGLDLPFAAADPAERHLANLADDGRRRRQHRHRGQESDHHHHQERAAARGHGWADRRSRRQQRHRHPAEAAVGAAPLDAGAPLAADAVPADGAATARADKRFLFCFPYVRSHRMRSQILRCSVSGLFLVLMLGIFVALMTTHNIYNSEFAVLLILILLFTTVFFAHSLVRIGLLVLHPPSPAEEEADAARRLARRRQRAAGAAAAAAGAGAGGARLPDVYGPGGYAIPPQPIRVVLARDEEAAGLESVTAKMQPPAYGLWRESVRVDPNRIYWQRNDGAPPVPGIGSGSTSRSGSSTRVGGSSTEAADSSSSSSSSRTGDDGSSTGADGNDGSAAGRQSPRPPSYVSEDGVQYVVEAHPRSIAPTTAVPLVPHPAEAGRIGAPAAW